MYIDSLPPTIQAFKDATHNLETEPDKKKKRKLTDISLNAKQNIIPEEMATALNQIKDTLLRSKVASLILFVLGENNQKGFYQHLTGICKKYPHGGIIEPEPKEVYDVLIELGFSVSSAKKMSTPPKED